MTLIQYFSELAYRPFIVGLVLLIVGRLRQSMRSLVTIAREARGAGQ